MEEKAWKKAERQRVVEEEKRKRRMMEYLQWLRDKVLEEETTLLERAEGSQVAGSKCKKVTAGDEEVQRPFKKARGKQPEKYRRGAAVKMGGSNPCERCVHRAGLPGVPLKVSNFYYTYYYYFLIISFFIADFSHMLGASLLSSDVYPIPTPIPQL